MDAKVKSLFIAGLVGVAGVLGTEQLAKLEWMQQHPEAWYIEAGACAALAYLVRKKNFTAALALVATAGVLGVQGYRHSTGASPSSPSSPATPQSVPQLPPNQNPGPIPPQLPPAQAQGQTKGTPILETIQTFGDTFQELYNQGAFGGGDFGMSPGSGNLGESPLQGSPDNTGALLRRRRNMTGALLRNSAMRFGR